MHFIFFHVNVHNALMLKNISKEHSQKRSTQVALNSRSNLHNDQCLNLLKSICTSDHLELLHNFVHSSFIYFVKIMVQNLWDCRIKINLIKQRFKCGFGKFWWQISIFLTPMFLFWWNLKRLKCTVACTSFLLLVGTVPKWL